MRGIRRAAESDRRRSRNRGGYMVPHAMGGPRYDWLGTTYTATRREDPELAAQIHAALGQGRTLLNVGAGAGAYEPRDRTVLAVEPSPVMIAQRPADAAPAVLAAAERLPFVDASFDAAMALHTVHHWNDPAAGLGELRRVARRVVVVAGDAGVIDRLWLTAEYFPGLAFGARREVQPQAIAERLGGRTRDPAAAGSGRLPRRLHGGVHGATGGLPRPSGASQHVDVPAAPRGSGRRRMLGCAATSPRVRGMPATATCASCLTSTRPSDRRLRPRLIDDSPREGVRYLPRGSGDGCMGKECDYREERSRGGGRRRRPGLGHVGGGGAPPTRRRAGAGLEPYRRRPCRWPRSRWPRRMSPRRSSRSRIPRSASRRTTRSRPTAPEPVDEAPETADEPARLLNRARRRAATSGRRCAIPAGACR